MEWLSRVNGEERIKIDETRVNRDGELKMGWRNKRRVANDEA